MTLTFILLFVSFVGAILGLMGKSWDDSQTKKVKLTIRGWISLIIIILGFLFTGIKTFKTQKQNESLKEQKEQVRTLAYEKILKECQTILKPLLQIYLENSIRPKDAGYDFALLCEEMINENGMEVFRNLNLLDSVKSGTAFDEWDRSYADYLNGYYNWKGAYSLEQTMTQWGNYIDMEDLILIDSINNHFYWLVLRNINYGNTEYEKDEYINKVGVLYYFDNEEETLNGQKEFIQHILRLSLKAKEVISRHRIK